MARKKNKTKPPAAPPKKPPPAPPGLTSSVQDEPSNQPKPTTTTPIPDSVKSECEQALNAQEERRKEMRLLQQKLYAPNPQQDDDRISLESLSGPKIKLANKRKNAELQKMTTEWIQRITSVRKYWNSLSVEKRRSFLEVSFHDLCARYSSENDVLVLGVLSEALSYAEHKKTLKFWVCCCCSSEFKDCESHKQHVLAHISNLEANFQGVLPKEVDSSSVDMILNGCWKPVDLNAAMKILENQATRQPLTTADTINQRWPLVNDPKRAKHLESIQFMFQLLLKNKCLADVHVQTAIRAAMGELENLAPGLELIDHGLDKTPACICFLGADMLPNIFLYLHRLWELCKLGKDSEKTTSVDDTQGVDALVSDVLEGITLSDDSHHLILNEFLLTTVTVSNKAENATLGEDGGPDKDEFLYWMFRPSSTDVEPVSWTCKREDRGRRQMEIFEKLKMEIYLLRTLCQDKFTHKCYIEACCTLSRLCDEEIRKRDYSVGYVAQSLESLLRKRYEDLAVREDDPVYERTAISFVLEEYQALNVTSSNREDLRMQDDLDQADDRLLDVIENQKQPSYKEMGNYDAMIMQKLAAMQQLERELEAISAIDYRGIMLFLVKKLLRERLEDIAGTDAQEKFDAAMETLSQELPDERNHVNRRPDDSKQIQEKSKKKKKRDYRRYKNLKGAGRESRDKELLSHQETEQVTLVAESVYDLKQLEEEREEDERKLAEKLDYQIRIENEAKQKRLADKSLGSSVGFHTGSVERIAVPGPSNQGISEDGLSPSGSQAHTSDGHSQTISEKENHEASLSQIEGCFKEQTHPWVDPHLGDNETKALAQLSAEEHDEERFQADLTKVVPERLGISEDGLSPSGRQAHGQNPASDGHSQTLSEKENHEVSPSQIDEERLQADLTKVEQESLGPSNQGISEDGLSPSGRQAHSQSPTSDGHSKTLSEKENHEASPSQIDDERFQPDLTKAVQENLEPQKIMDPAHKIIAVRKFWNMLSVEKKLTLLLVSHHDLMAHYMLEEDGLAADVLLEALSFIESNETWKFWACCLCGENFADCESHKQHVWVHIGDLLLKLQPVLPKEADSGWADMLLNGGWEPVDLHASMKILENRVTHESLTTADSSDVGTHTNGSNRDCLCEFFSTVARLLNKICLLSEKKREFSSDDRDSKAVSEVQVVDEESKAKVVCGRDLPESGNCNGISSSDLRGDGNKHWVEAYPIPQSWPSVDDPKCAKLLDGIHGMFQLLLKHKCLADTHLKKVIRYTMDELQGLAPGLQLLDHGLDQTPACIRFLDATQLQNVLDLLQELSNSCQLCKDSEKTTSADDTQGVDTRVIDVLEGINLSWNTSHPISNKFLLTGKTNKAESASMGEKVSVLNEDGGPGGDAFVSWLFASYSADAEAVSWTHRREDKSRCGTEILQELEKEFDHLQKLCQVKCEYLCYMEALCTLLDLCYEEFKKRHHSVEYVAQSFEALLRKRQEELVETKDNPVFINSKFEENAISLVLKEEETLNVTQCGQPGLTSHVCDLESSNKEDSRTLDNLYQADKSILLGIRTHGSKFSLEICRLDARIRQKLTAMQQLECELGAMSSFDYREILFFLTRPLWRAHLEDLADKDAKEKSDAAREALSPELTLESKNNINKGGLLL